MESVVSTGSVDVDSFQFGSPAVVGDDGEDDTDSDTLSADSGTSALDPTARVFDRSGRGIRAAQYIDQTDYDDMMLADVPEHEHSAALVESVSDADICGSSGSHTDASRDVTYDGTSESNASSDEQLVGLLDDLALSDGSSDEDPVDSHDGAAVDRVDVPAHVDELTSKLKNLTCSTAPATKIKVAEIDIADTMGPIGTLTDESGTSYADFDGQDDHTEQKPQKDFFLQNSCRAREFPLTDQLGDNEVAVGTGRRDAQTIPTGCEHAVSSPDCDEESTVGSPSSIKANRAVHFSTDLPGGQPTVHVLNQSTEAVDRIYWAFSSQPPTVPIDVDGPPADWPQSATFSSLPDLAETERGLAGLPGTPVHTYLSVDFTDDQLCPVWDASLAMGPLSGQTLIDSGASRHSLGRLGMKYAQNVRRIDPLIMNTANG